LFNLKVWYGLVIALIIEATPIPMPTLLIVYHSMTRGTEQMAQACAAAARLEGNVEVILKQAGQTTADDVRHASGYVFATPEYLGSMSGMMKDFFDRTYYEVIEQINARPYAIMVCAGSDGQGAVRQIDRLVTGWRLKQVAPAVIVNVQAQTKTRILQDKHLIEAQLRACAELGTLMATGLGMSVF